MSDATKKAIKARESKKSKPPTKPEPKSGTEGG